MKKRSLGILVFCLLLFGLCGTAFAAEKTKSPYYITVNLTANVVTVYEKDAAGNYTVPIKAFRCSGGTDTPEGTFRTSAKYAHYMGMCGGSMPHALRDRISFILCLIMKRTKPHWNMMNSTNWGQLHPQGASV